jgi:hypothetical protein
MIRGIDHLVLAVEDPDAAAEALGSALGLDADPGGRHEALGTFNRLIWLGDSYLELIGVFDRALAADSWIGRPTLAGLAGGSGLATWAVAVDDVAAHLRWLPPDAGVTGPLDGARTRPDGRVVRWRLAGPPDLAPTVPFLIEHDEAGAEWTPVEREARAAAEHPIGGRVRLAALEVRTERPAADAGRVRRLLASSIEPGGRRAVRLAVGRHTVRFASPPEDGGPTARVELLVDRPLRRRTARLGDCEIVLAGLPAPRPAPSADGAEAP